MKTKTQSIQEKFGLPLHPELVYIDQRDKVEDFKMIEKMVQAGDYQAIEENSWEWIADAQSGSADEIIKETRKDHPDLTDEDEDAIRNWLYEHDESTPIQDLLRNTPSCYFYYSLGLDVSPMELEGGEPDEDRIKSIMEWLQIDDPAFEKSCRSLVGNAGYGGRLVILFENDIEEMLEDGDVIEFGPKTELCIMDRCNGSGFSVPLGRTLIMEFNRKNLHCDRGAPGYSFTHEVCGMVQGFMGAALIRSSKPEDKILPATVNVREQNQMAREAAIDKRWRETKTCTFGDMNINRHPKTNYRLDFPAGNKCPKCGTFWID